MVNRRDNSYLSPWIIAVVWLKVSAPKVSDASGEIVLLSEGRIVLNVGPSEVEVEGSRYLRMYFAWHLRLITIMER